MGSPAIIFAGLDAGGESKAEGEGKEEVSDTEESPVVVFGESEKSIVRFTFFAVNCSTSPLTKSSISLSLRVETGVCSRPAKYNSLAISSGLRFFLGDGFAEFRVLGVARPGFFRGVV